MEDKNQPDLILIVFVPLRRFSFMLGTHMKESKKSTSKENLDFLKKNGVAIPVALV
jgi:hypothetical protein